MSKEEAKRLLTLKFQGDAIKDHSISVRLLTKSLSSVQKLLLHLTESIQDSRPRQQGRSPESTASECELFLKSLNPNCVTAQLALPSKTESLFPSLPDLAEEVLFRAKECFLHFSEGNNDPFVEFCPNPVHRRHVLKDLATIAPEERSNYSLIFLGNDLTERPLYRPPRSRLREMISMATTLAPVEDALPRLVNATGMAVVKGSEILEWKATYDVLELDLEAAWRPELISYNGISLRLKHPIAVAIEEKAEGVFVATHDQLNIHAFGYSREEAMEAFAQEFIVLWREIAEENDDMLTHDAQFLKNTLRDLVTSRDIL